MGYKPAVKECRSSLLVINCDNFVTFTTNTYLSESLQGRLKTKDQKMEDQKKMTERKMQYLKCGTRKPVPENGGQRPCCCCLAFFFSKTKTSKLSYRKQIARKLRTQYVEGIYRPNYPVTLKSRLRVTQGH